MSNEIFNNTTAGGMMLEVPGAKVLAQVFCGLTEGPSSINVLEREDSQIVLATGSLSRSLTQREGSVHLLSNGKTVLLQANDLEDLVPDGGKPWTVITDNPNLIVAVQSAKESFYISRRVLANRRDPDDIYGHVFRALQLYNGHMGKRIQLI